MSFKVSQRMLKTVFAHGRMMNGKERFQQAGIRQQRIFYTEALRNQAMRQTKQEISRLLGRSLDEAEGQKLSRYFGSMGVEGLVRHAEFDAYETMARQAVEQLRFGQAPERGRRPLPTDQAPGCPAPWDASRGRNRFSYRKRQGKPGTEPGNGYGRLSAMEGWQEVTGKPIERFVPLGDSRGACPKNRIRPGRRREQPDGREFYLWRGREHFKKACLERGRRWSGRNTQESGGRSGRESGRRDSKAKGRGNNRRGSGSSRRNGWRNRQESGGRSSRESSRRDSKAKAGEITGAAVEAAGKTAGEIAGRVAAEAAGETAGEIVRRAAEEAAGENAKRNAGGITGAAAESAGEWAKK